MTTYKIPCEKMSKGIALCKDNVIYLLDDARTLIEKDKVLSRSHAVALIVLAIEEMGKAKVLSESLELSKNRGLDIAEVDEDLFKRHPPKFKEGCSLLPADALVIKKGIFDPRIFDPNIFETGVEANPEIRKDATYVNWDPYKKLWKIGTRANSERLKKLIVEIGKALNKI